MTSEDARIPYVRRCLLQRKGGRADAVICSLGAENVYVTLLSPSNQAIPDVGETVRLCFVLPGDPRPIDVDAIVASRMIHERENVEGMPRGCALNLTSLRPDDSRRIRELIDDFRSSPRPRIAVPAPYSGFVRIPYVETCLFVGETDTSEGVICNLSLLGAYVTMVPSPPMGARGRLFFRTPRKQDPMEIACEVAWTNDEESSSADSLPPGYGLRFLDDGARGEIELLILEYESLPRL